MENTAQSIPPLPPGVASLIATPIIPFTGQLLPREHTVQDLAVTVAANTNREDILSGEFWVHVANRMVPFCEIRVMWDDGSKYAVLLCIDVAGRFSRFKCLQYHELEVIEGRTIGFEHNLELKNKGAIKKWCIVDTQSGHIYKEMIATQKQGFIEIEDMIKARSR